MEKIKQILESTLINNLGLDAYEAFKLGSEITNTSNIIAEEIKDIAIEYSEFEGRLSFKERTTIEDSILRLFTQEELFNQFINDKYKES